MAKKTRNSDVQTTDYRHTREKRTNNPPAKIAAEGAVPRVQKMRYHYSPHLPPMLQFDPSGKADELPTLLAEAARRPLTEPEQKLLAQALRSQQPWLEWAGKREQHERGFLEVDPVALHIHERISTQAILRVLDREDVQRDLFADPQQPYAQAVQFYKHSVAWANRLILGDSLQVMTSLAKREQLAGKVQMIYLDPPYGIKFGSNFQPEVGRREVGDRDKDLTREPETVKAYRDTWTLGVHSYLTYLRDRLVAAHDLLSDSGHIFIQIGEDNVHLVRRVLEEIFGPENYVLTILLKKKAGQKSTTISPLNDYILWCTKDRPTALQKFSPLFTLAKHNSDYLSLFGLAELPTGEVLSISALSSLNGTDYREHPDQLFRDYAGVRLLTSGDATIGGVRKNQSVLFDFQRRQFDPGLQRGNCWKHTAVDREAERSGMRRLAEANRLLVGDTQLRIKRYADDFGAFEVNNWWDEFGGAPDRVYAVQTNSKVIERCILMCTAPGDLVLDPTCGSGTTAYVAEQWGRRWITIDTSRVAIALARQRMLTANFDYYRVKEERPIPGSSGRETDYGNNPSAGFVYKTLPHVTSSVIANCVHLDPLIDKHEPILRNRLNDLNAALKQVKPDLRQKLAGKLAEKQKRKGKKSITEADRRRWELPTSAWQHWEVPFDVDSEWPESLQDALSAYRTAWRAKMDEINKCIAANAEIEELVDKPEVVGGVVRVAGPFTVEGVRPEELSLAKDGIGMPTREEIGEEGAALESNGGDINAYLARMVGHLRADGLTFLGNQRRKFSRLDPLFEDASASLIHAEGAWENTNGKQDNAVGVSFGPEHGPITALQIEEAIRAAKQYDDLVFAGFSFDAEAFAIVHEQNHPKLRIHLAHIRPDLNEAMDGLLKETGSSELFAVFGQPEIDVCESKDGWICTLKGVDIYNPLDNTVRSSGAEKVAAWFLDGDFDGRCFCITQAFFPDQDAWEKIADALGSSADLDAFEQLKGTTSLPFPKGKYGEIAVKVIDPRGNEVMAIRKLT